MTPGLSARIVQFIGGLFPLYQSAEVDRVAAALSLADGTLIFALEETEDNAHGLVRVHWQGDPDRSCEVSGEAMASIAVARYVELHGVSVDKRTKDNYEVLAQHFTVKTGSSLVLDGGYQVPEEFKLLGRLLEKSGTAVASAMLKKALGL